PGDDRIEGVYEARNMSISSRGFHLEPRCAVGVRCHVALLSNQSLDWNQYSMINQSLAWHVLTGRRSLILPGPPVDAQPSFQLPEHPVRPAGGANSRQSHAGQDGDDRRGHVVAVELWPHMAMPHSPLQKAPH